MTTRVATDEDLLELDATMLAHDRTELEAVTTMPTIELLRLSRDTSLWTRTLVVDGVVGCVFGVSGCITDETGAPWMIGAQILERRPLPFLRVCRHWVGEMRRAFPVLENHVWAGNVRAVRWLRWLDFELEDARPFGYLGLPFHRFTMGARDV